MTNYKIKLRRYNGTDYDTLQITAEDVIDDNGNDIQTTIDNMSEDITELQSDYESGTNNGWTYVKIGNIITATKTVNLTNINLRNTFVGTNFYYSDWISLGALPTNINQAQSQIFGVTGRVKNGPDDIYGGVITNAAEIRVRSVSILDNNAQVRISATEQYTTASIPVLCQIIGPALS